MGVNGQTVELELVTELDVLRAEWNDVAEASRNVFATWEWISTWWRHFGGDRPLAITACRAPDGTLRAIIPCYEWATRPLRIVRFVGSHKVGGEQGPICGPDDRAVAADALRATLDLSPYDLFLGERLSPTDGWADALQASVQQRFPCPLLRLNFHDWDDYLASCSSNFRQQLRRKERKLFREHELSYRLVTHPDDLDAHLESFLALHAARWSDESSVFLDAEALSFHREFARLAAERGWLRLWFLELDGMPAAAWYGFRFSGIETYHQLGRDPNWESASVGLLIVAHSIREALADGMEEYRLGPGGLSYKYRFGADDSEIETIALAPSIGGKAALAAGQLVRRSGPLKKALRKALSI